MTTAMEDKAWSVMGQGERYRSVSIFGARVFGPVLPELGEGDSR